MLELGSRQNMTGMETERARGKCIANALVCQLLNFLVKKTSRRHIATILALLYTYSSLRLPTNHSVNNSSTTAVAPPTPWDENV